MTYIQDESTRREKALAWAVHLYTASGAIWGLLAILAMGEGNWLLAFMWMLVTIFIDAVDGTLARKFRVKDVVPTFDGALLDNIVDYFTYVLVPAVALYHGDIVPANLLVTTIAMITLSSAYQFCQVDAKVESDDHYFTGWPSYWNVLVIYLFLLGWSPLINFVALAVCAVLVFVPIRYIYPSRTRAFQRITLSLNLIWAFAFVAIIALYPNAPSWLLHGSMLFILYYGGVSFYLTFRSSKRQNQ